uniref:Uncharacterized protein n=1 Tax=Salix viminalis TaxID=40686 RepID=A0A6N2M014_SALVM
MAANLRPNPAFEKESNKKEMGICVCTDSRKDTASLRAPGVDFQSRAATIARATLFAMWLLLLLSSIE